VDTFEKIAWGHQEVVISMSKYGHYDSIVCKIAKNSSAIYSALTPVIFSFTSGTSATFNSLELSLSQAITLFKEGCHIIFYTLTNYGKDVIGVSHQRMDVIAIALKYDSIDSK
jgi:hypothetical protein